MAPLKTIGPGLVNHEEAQKNYEEGGEVMSPHDTIYFKSRGKCFRYFKGEERGLARKNDFKKPPFENYQGEKWVIVSRGSHFEAMENYLWEIFFETMSIIICLTGQNKSTN